MSSSSPCSEPLGAPQIEARLAEFLDPLRATLRHLAPVAEKLVALPRPQQEYALHWGAVAARINIDLAYHFCLLAPRAFAVLDEAGIEAWLVAALDAYDSKGLVAASAILRQLDAFAAQRACTRDGVAFGEVVGVLELFVRGLSGRPLRLAVGEAAYTDTATLFLPADIAHCSTREENAALYRASVAHLWAQTRFGTFRGDLAPLIEADEAVLAWFGVAEGVRLHACVAAELPGLGRQLACFQTALGADLDEALKPLAGPSADAQDSRRLARELARSGAAPSPWPYLGRIFPARALAVRDARLARERVLLRNTLAELAHQLGGEKRDSRLSLQRREDAGAWEPTPYELRVDGLAGPLPPEVSALVASMVQDLGELPPELLQPAGAGEWSPARTARGGDEGRVAAEEGAAVYPEWDYERRHYRKDWCVLRERPVHPGDPEFVRRALARHGYQVRRLKRSFEALRGEERLVKREPYGDDIDLDAIVAARSELLAGEELPQRLFVRRHRIERDIAVMFMVDMSGSTKGWINDAEREALLMLCEAIELLGDRYAIYGFSGMTRLRCEVFRIKRFDEPYSDLVRGRIAGIEPLDYTRMGVAIRHLTRLLNETAARTRLLITLSDGKPDDFNDVYRGRYGIEDTRQALVEARNTGVHPFCITIDEEARDYLPHMYGAASWALVRDVSSLPYKVSDIYRRLTG